MKNNLEKIRIQRELIALMRLEATWVIKSNKPVKQRLAIWHSRCDKLDMYLALAEKAILEE